MAVDAERPSELIVDALVDAGNPIVPVHPNAVKASRPRHRVSVAKDDRGDAYLLADLLRAAPWGLADPAEADAKCEMVRALGAVLGLLIARIIDLTARTRNEVAASEDGRILMSFPRAGQRCAAQILAELGEDRVRYLTPDQLAADADLAPITRPSGKCPGVSFR
jgi:transposase